MKMKPLILALDVFDYEEAMNYVDMLSDHVDIFKVGPILFLKHGHKVVNEINKKGKKVFLDMKFHDIPATVERSVKSAGDLGVYSLTLHSCGGMEMLQRASLLKNRPKLWAVTVLTSQDTSTKEVVKRAKLAKDAGVDGVISSVHEASQIKKACGSGFSVITPGIRFADRQDDQKRVATPKAAIESGADFIVVGRPVLEADDPIEMVDRIYGNIDGK